MSDSDNGSNLIVTIAGDISPREILEILKQHYTDRDIWVDGDSSSHNYRMSRPGDIIISTMLDSQGGMGREDYSDMLAAKNKKISELEATTAKALDSVQTFQRQHQALYDRFVALRQMFDEQKLSLLNTLWIHCGAYHPELREIPVVEDMAKFIETEDRVGEYQVGETLGQGQFATVRSCCRDGSKFEMAVKIIKKDRFTTFTALKRISNEIEILRKLKSEFIVSVSDVVQTMNNLYIVTEKGGRDLFESFDDKADGVPESWAKEIIVCVLKAVLYCHDRDICHRDLKPENILLTFDKDRGKCVNLKLCDFGLSTRFNSTQLLTDFCGSPGFFAPEMIIAGSYQGDKVDVWSTGCILLELLFGHRRFIDVWMIAYDYEVLQSKEAFTVEMKDTVDKLPRALTFSTQLNDFIMQLLILNPKDRLKTRTICMHPWLEGAFDTLLASRSQSISKQKSTRKPSIADIINQSESTANIAPVRSQSLTKEKGRLEELLMKGQGSYEMCPESVSTVVISNDIQDSGSGLGSVIASRSLDQSLGYFKEKSPKHGTLSSLSTGRESQDVDDYLLKVPRGVGVGFFNSQSNPVLGNLRISSPSSSGKSMFSMGPSGEERDSVSEKSHETASPLRRFKKNCRGSFNLNLGDLCEPGNLVRRVSEGEVPLRIGSMILPPICTDLISPRNRPIVLAYGANDEDESGEMDSLSAAAKDMVSAALSSLQRENARRQDAITQQPTSNLVDADSISVANSCNSGGSGSGVSFFGYGNRQYLAPRGSFANEFVAPRGSFANDFSAPRGSFAQECNAPRGSFANECTAPRGSFANEFCGPRGSFATEINAVRNMFAVDMRGSFASDVGNSVNSNALERKVQGQRDEFGAARANSIPSIASSVTISPTGTTLTTPSQSVGPATPSLRNIDEESSDEITSIDELRNFLIAGSFTFTGPNANSKKK